MKNKLKLLLLFALSIAIAAGMDSCKKNETDPKAPQWWSHQDGKKDLAEPEQQDDPIEDSRVKMFEQVVKVDDGNVVNFDCDTVNNHYSVTFSGAVPEDVKPGKVLVVNKDKELTVVLVTGVEKSGNTAELEGMIGDLSYVFYDTEFAIASDPSFVDNKDIPVYTPQNNGKSLSKAKGEINFSRKIDDWTLSFKCAGGVEPTGSEDANGFRSGINTNVTPSFTIKYKNGKDISGEVSISGEVGINTNFSFVYWNRYGKPVCERQADYDFYKAETLEQQFYIDGELSFVPSFTVEAKGKISTDDKCKRVHLGEMLGVPIPTSAGDVYFALDWFADASFSCSAAATLKFNDNKAKVGLTGRLGYAEYKDGSGSIINSIKLINDDPNISLSAQCDANLSFAIYPLLSASWISKKTLGLGLGIKPVAEADIKLKYEANTSPSEQNYLATSGSFSVTPKICLGAIHEEIFGDETEFYPIPISIDEKGFSTTYKMAPIKEKKFTDTDKWEADGDFLEIFPPFFKLECPGALYIKSIADGESSKTYTITDVDKDKMENNIIDFPIKKGVPITISFRPYTLMTWDFPGLTTVRVNGGKLVDFSFPPNVIYLKSSDPKFSDWVFGCYPDYKWTPISDNDYLEATICDANGDVKGYCKIRNSESPAVLTVDTGDTDVEKGSSMPIWGSADCVCDIIISVDENEIKRFSQTTSFSLELPTDNVGTHTVVIYAKANGRRDCSTTLQYNVKSGQDYSSVDISQGLVAYYPFDANADDYSGNGNNGTITNLALVSGVKGNAYKFAGVDNPGWIQIPNSESLQFENAASFSMWFNVSSYRGQDGWANTTDYGCLKLFSKDYDRDEIHADISGSDDNKWHVSFWGVVSGREGSWSELEGNILNQWHHAVFIATSHCLKIYIDGKLVNEKECEPNFSYSKSKDLWIGRLNSRYAYYFNGLIDEFRVYNRELNEYEVQALFYGK